MAQKDIQDIADFMKSVDESKVADDIAYDEACKECDELQKEEFENEALEDEVIDKASLGFIDDADINDESDEFYSENDNADTFNEDVSDCVEQEVVDGPQIASIEVEVYNEDDFGKYFTEEVNRNIPGVKAFVKKTLPNGDLLVKMSGEQDDLENAFAFYVGAEDFDMLSPDDKKQFTSLLVFDDGDTLAEADYREAVAHCLDGIDVNASTANLADQDTCAISVIKEEKAKRFAKKAVKCLKESDFSYLSDDDLDKLDALKDRVENGGMSAEEKKTWDLVLAGMGITQKEWDAMTPEQQDKFWNASLENQPSISKTGFDDVHIGVDPKTGKKFRYRNQWQFNNPETGDADVTAFNPAYDQEHSLHQHPGEARIKARKDAEAAKAADAQKRALDAMRSARGKDTWDIYEFGQMIGGLDDKQRKQLMNELIDAVEKDHPDDSREAGKETMFIKKIFGKKLTLRDFAKAWGKSAPGVMKFADETEAIWRRTLRDMGITSTRQFKNMPQPKFEQFLQLLKINMEGRKGGSIVSGR